MAIAESPSGYTLRQLLSFVVLGVLLFLILLWYCSQIAFQGVRAHPGSPTPPGVPAQFDRAYQFDDLYVRELFIPEHRLGIRIALTDSSLQPAQHLDILMAIRTYRLTGELSPEIDEKLIKYGSAHFDARRAQPIDKVFGGSTSNNPSFTYFTGARGKEYAIALLSGSGKQALVIGSASGLPLQSEVLNRTLMQIEELKPLRDIAPLSKELPE